MFQGNLEKNRRQFFQPFLISRNERVRSSLCLQYIVTYLMRFELTVWCCNCSGVLTMSYTLSTQYRTCTHIHFYWVNIFPNFPRILSQCYIILYKLWSIQSDLWFKKKILILLNICKCKKEIIFNNTYFILFFRKGNCSRTLSFPKSSFSFWIIATYLNCRWLSES